MSLLVAHAVCALLAVADQVARAWRIRLLLRALGHPLSLGDAITLNAFGDAACAVTPLRLGGQPARVAGLLRARVPAGPALGALGIEVLVEWPVVATTLAVVMLTLAPRWWATTGSRLAERGVEASAWVLGVVAISVVAWWLGRRLRPRRTPRSARPPLVTRAREALGRLTWPELLATVALTLVNITARVAVLPVLAATLPGDLDLDAAVVGSFALIYSQLVLPTPSGAGAVELGFLGGAAGDLAAGGVGLLAAWRFWTSGVGIVLGGWLAVRAYGWRILNAIRGREPSPRA